MKISLDWCNTVMTQLSCIVDHVLWINKINLIVFLQLAGIDMKNCSFSIVFNPYIKFYLPQEEGNVEETRVGDCQRLPLITSSDCWPQNEELLITISLVRLGKVESIVSGKSSENDTRRNNRDSHQDVGARVEFLSDTAFWSNFPSRKGGSKPSSTTKADWHFYDSLLGGMKTN